MEMQHPELRPTNWNAILPYLGYKTETSCGLNGIIELQKKEYLLGLDGEVLLGDGLITMMKILAGEKIDIYWLDSNNGDVIKALIYLRGTDRIICEAVPKPTYNRATIERTDRDKKNYETMSAYVATIEGYARMKVAKIAPLVVIDNTPQPLKRSFVINPVPRCEEPNNDEAFTPTTIEQPVEDKAWEEKENDWYKEQYDFDPFFKK
jgi:hypothetical protein